MFFKGTECLKVQNAIFVLVWMNTYFKVLLHIFVLYVFIRGLSSRILFFESWEKYKFQQIYLTDGARQYIAIEDYHQKILFSKKKNMKSLPNRHRNPR